MAKERRSDDDSLTSFSKYKIGRCLSISISPLFRISSSLPSTSIFIRSHEFNSSESNARNWVLHRSLTYANLPHEGLPVSTSSDVATNTFRGRTLRSELSARLAHRMLKFS